MYVPNYIPEQVEVPGNVAEASFGSRIAFLRKVSLYSLASALIVLAVAAIPVTKSLLPYAIAGWAALLLGCDVVRVQLRGRLLEAQIATFMLIFVLAAYGVLAGQVIQAGFPVWAPVAGVFCVALYSLSCGRDFSFVGCWLISTVCSSILIWVSSWVFPQRFGLFIALLVNALVVLYYVYDLAAIQSRRRVGEEWASVLDLYRDMFNFPGYFKRLWKHWQRHRIWADLK